MKIAGNSRASVRFSTIGKMDVVIKSAYGSESQRLAKQIEKQIACESNLEIKTPRVISCSKELDKFEAVMEFIHGLDFVTFTSSCSAEEFESVISKLVHKVKIQFDSSTLESFPTQTWNKKVSFLEDVALQKNIDPRTVSKISVFLRESVPEKVLIGPCHGDLTFSNVIVERDGSICLFDFLDPPINTPIEDVSKLLQDAEFFWTLKKYSGQCDKTRVMIMWSYAKKLILKEFEDLIELRVLSLFQVMTLARIIPYTSDSIVIQYLLDCILRKIDENDLAMRR